jgi:hypothetical protein
MRRLPLRLRREPLSPYSVEVTDDGPASYCKLTGYVSPEVRFEVRLLLAPLTVEARQNYSA